MVDAVNKANDGAPLPEQDKVAGTTNAGAPLESDEKKEAIKRAKKAQQEADAAPTDPREVIKGAKKRLEEPAQNQAPQEEEPKKAAPAKSSTDFELQGNDNQEQSRFVQINPKHQQVLHKHPKWGAPIIDENLAETIDKGQVKRTMTGGINFVLNNSHTVMWRPNYGARPQIGNQPAREGVEFVGIRTGSFLKKFDEMDAKAIISVSKMRGWNDINVHGNAQQKGMMWLEAQRQGLTVSNFVPSPELAEKWKIEQQQREADKHLIGVNNAADGIPVPEDEDKKPAQEAKKEAPKNKQEKKPVSNFQTKSAKGKRTTKPSVRTVGPIEGETTDQYFSRKINNAKTDEEKEGFRALAAALQNGDLNIEDVQMTKLLRDELSGTTIAQELSVAKKVLGGLSPAVNDSIIKRDITTTSENAAAKAEGNAVKAETVKSPKVKAAAAATP
jgi:hypothetical protein